MEMVLLGEASVGQRILICSKQKSNEMKNVILKYGLLAGLVQVVVGNSLMAILFRDMEPNIRLAEVLGYATMIVALSFIFFGIRAYRDQHEGGTITFGKAVKVGILITLVASALYVIGWIIFYHLGSGREIMDGYLAQSIEDIRNSGQPAAVIDQEINNMEGFMEMYEKPIVMIGMTFLEIFPVGLIISLIAAALLRKKPDLAVNN